MCQRGAGNGGFIATAAALLESAGKFAQAERPQRIGCFLEVRFCKNEMPKRDRAFAFRPVSYRLGKHNWE
jgi:hypothetical protein